MARYRQGTRNDILHMRVVEADKARWMAAAKRAGVSLSTWVIERLNRVEPSPEPELVWHGS